MKKYKSGFLIVLMLLAALFMAVTLSACDIHAYLYGEQEQEEEEQEEAKECEHNYVISANGLKPTCQQEGYDLFICSKCNAEKRQTLEKVGHEYRNNVCRWCGENAPAKYSVDSGNGATLLIYESTNIVNEKSYAFWFEGNGTFSDASTSKWQSYLKSLKTVRISGNVGLPAKAFYNAEYLYEVTILGSIVSVGKEAFFGCTSLKTFDFPNGLRTIGDGAFKNCDELTDVTIPDSLTSMGENVFSGCDRLRNLTLPFIGSKNRQGADVTFGSIFGVGTEKNHSQVYEENEQKTYFSIPDSLRNVTVTGGEDVRSYSFAYCSAPIEKLSYSAELKKIEDYAFFCNSGLERIEFATGSELNDIEEHAFDNCTELLSFSLPAGVKTVKMNAFSRCLKMSEFVFEEGSAVTTIAADAFLSCISLQKISFPVGLTTVETGAFKGCTALEEVHIGENVVSLGIKSFADCSLSKVYIDSTTVANTTSNNESRLYGPGPGFELWIEENVTINSLSYVNDHYTCPNKHVLTEVGGKNYRYWKIK